MDERVIRFIDTHCKELFTLPDGGSIVMTHPDGRLYMSVCKYLDETHAEITGSCYHLRQFADLMDRNGVKVEPETAPEMVGAYRVIRRIPVGDKVYVMGHSPTSPQPYATWQAYRDKPDKDWGHYWTDRNDADTDLYRRAEAERTCIPYDHTKLKSSMRRDDAR